MRFKKIGQRPDLEKMFLSAKSGLEKLAQLNGHGKQCTAKLCVCPDQMRHVLSPHLLQNDE